MGEMSPAEISQYIPCIVHTRYTARALSSRNHVHFISCTILPDRLMKHLQAVQNACARVILRRGKYDRVTLVLRELHWLPASCRVDYELAVLAFKCINVVWRQVTCVSWQQIISLRPTSIVLIGSHG